MWINIPDLEVAYLSSHEGSDSSIMCVTCLYELLYNYLWSRLLHPNSAKNSGAQRDRAKASDFSHKLKTTGSVTVYS